MMITALNFCVITIICLVVGYLLGYHVRSAMEQQEPRMDKRQKKSYEVKAERYFGPN